MHGLRCGDGKVSGFLCRSVPSLNFESLRFKRCKLLPSIVFLCFPLGTNYDAQPWIPGVGGKKSSALSLPPRAEFIKFRCATPTNVYANMLLTRVPRRRVSLQHTRRLNKHERELFFPLSRQIICKLPRNLIKISSSDTGKGVEK